MILVSPRDNQTVSVYNNGEWEIHYTPYIPPKTTHLKGQAMNTHILLTQLQPEDHMLQLHNALYNYGTGAPLEYITQNLWDQIEDNLPYVTSNLYTEHWDKILETALTIEEPLFEQHPQLQTGGPETWIKLINTNDTNGTTASITLTQAICETLATHVDYSKLVEQTAWVWGWEPTSRGTLTFPQESGTPAYYTKTEDEEWD